jgi:hypothetical protein
VLRQLILDPSPLGDQPLPRGDTGHGSLARQELSASGLEARSDLSWKIEVINVNRKPA